MAQFKDPLSKNSWNLLSYHIGGAQGVDLNDLVNHLLQVVPENVSNQYGLNVDARPETVTIGGLLSKKDYPGIVFSFSDRPKYAKVLLSLGKVGAILDVEAIQYGSASKNMQHRNASQAETEFSLSGLAKKGLHSLMTDSNAVEEEEMYYNALVSSLKGCIENLMK